MAYRTPLGGSVAAVGLALLLCGACSGNGSTASAGTPDNETQSAPSTTAPFSRPRTNAPVPKVPVRVSDLPDGVYRTDLSLKKLQSVHLNANNAGLWTLIVKKGTYELDCRHTAEPGIDCGSSDPKDTLMEIGTVHGSVPTVWFVHDLALKEKLTGCKPAYQGCGPVGGYHFDWKVIPGGIEFSNFVGLGDEASEPALSTWTAQPWTKIS